METTVRKSDEGGREFKVIGGTAVIGVQLSGWVEFGRTVDSVTSIPGVEPSGAESDGGRAFANSNATLDEAVFSPALETLISMSPTP